MKFVVRKQYFSRPSEKIPNVSFISKFTCTILDEVSLRKLFSNRNVLVCSIIARCSFPRSRKVSSRRKTTVTTLIKCLYVHMRVCVCVYTFAKEVFSSRKKILRVRVFLHFPFSSVLCSRVNSIFAKRK